MNNLEQFSVIEVISTSCTIHRLQKGFVKKDPFDNRTSNSDLLYKHFFSDEKVNVNKKDRETAEDVIEYLKGLGFKALERGLTDFEKKVLKFVTSQYITKESLGIAASLPNVYFSKLKSDDWNYREKELGRTSRFQGTPNTRCKFNNIKIEFIKYIPSTGSHLVTSSIDDKHIIKFFTAKENVKLKNKYSISGYVKPHVVNNYTGFEETMINRVKIENN